MKQEPGTQVAPPQFALMKNNDTPPAPRNKQHAILGRETVEQHSTHAESATFSVQSHSFTQTAII
jgi:hypothetical protein